MLSSPGTHNGIIVLLIVTHIYSNSSLSVYILIDFKKILVDLDALVVGVTFSNVRTRALANSLEAETGSLVFFAASGTVPPASVMCFYKLG